MGSVLYVTAGGVKIGGGAPVTVQSMTNTDTRDVLSTIGQIHALQKAGCEIVRVSVYDEECAQAISAIKSKISIPLVADIHFDHRLAIKSIENGIDKLRINPGNIGGQARVVELVAAAKMHKVPIRIGVNAGSLQKDLLHKHGEANAQAMAESAMEHVRMLECEGFYDIVLSLKASDVKKTVEACRLVFKMVQYPQHIGVTEAGMGESALVKSAAGIGTLLIDGIGDTIRVSITGDPVQEVHAGLHILRALGVRKQGLEIISCPTCGRCSADLPAVIEEVKRNLPQTDRYFKLAIMGCVVNGPGEAKDADLGMAFGPSGCILFKNGEKLCTQSRENAVTRLIDEARLMLNS